MSDFSLKFKAEELGKSLENLAPDVVDELNQAVADTAHGAYAQIVATAQARLDKTRLDYLKNLRFDKIGDNAWLISLDGTWPTMLEDGFPAFDMRSTLLKSDKTVEVGSRAGQPWVRTGKEGQKYAAVPFQRRPHTVAKGAADMSEALRSLTAYNKKGRKQKLTSVFKDEFGRPLSGKVASVAKTPMKDLDNIVKYQKIYQNPNTGKKTVQSIYMNYRTISEKQPNGWQHPGYEGLKAFLEAEQFIEQSFEDIINALL